MWLTATKTAEAARPPRAMRRLGLEIRPLAPSVAWKLAHAASSESVQLQMLKVWLYQAFRFFSHSGMCWITPIRATSCGGGNITAGIRKTTGGGWDWVRAVPPRKRVAMRRAAPARVDGPRPAG